MRGGLGLLRVFWTKDSFRGKHTKPREWKLIYERQHSASWQELVPLVFLEPLEVPVGASIGLYVHSSAPNDESIVYDNQRGQNGHSDAFMTILPGMAHLGFTPFANNAPWGGGGWRDRRQFVGRVSYSVRYKLWSPKICQRFPHEFRRSALAFVNVHIFSWKGLPMDVVVYILNMLHPGWFSKDSIQSLKRAQSTRQALTTALSPAASLLTALTSTTTSADGHEQLVVVSVFRRWCSRCVVS